MGFGKDNLWDGLKELAQKVFLRAETLLPHTLCQNQFLYQLIVSLHIMSEVQLKRGHCLRLQHLSWFEGAAPLWPQRKTASKYLAKRTRMQKLFNSFLYMQRQ